MPKPTFLFSRSTSSGAFSCSACRDI
jgi:hypothetical protein